jgi:acyl carrier protein
MMLTRDEILRELTQTLVTFFEVPEEDVRLDAHLYEDLDLDSIDSVDLAIKLQELTGKKISPEEFKSVRTVGDVLDQVEKLVEKVA